ncbi:hypothetical protein QR680_010136 [Steinernema hermaphroditum]|uniref:TILa domain-containing protein n=1 Tax=Steinernema hermaphroditum TaxID=289476 RepID=A0AA39IPT3_9BILA|nr:hypothetical protein QR680_010136 [Steinernema hermaphroditum]
MMCKMLRFILLTFIISIACAEDNDCPATDGKCTLADGELLADEQTVLTNNCRQIQLCGKGVLITQDYQCPKNSMCGKENGKEACVCSAGFEWSADKETCQQVVQGNNNKDADNNNCIDLDGLAFEDNRSVLSQGCTKLQACMKGQVYTRDYQCPADSHCGREFFCGYNRDACVCNSGFQWDQNKKFCLKMADDAPKNQPLKPTRQPCEDEYGTIYPTDRSVIVNNCKQIKYCAVGRVVAQDYTCPSNTVCGTHNNAQACVCPNGSQWKQNLNRCVAPLKANECMDTDGQIYSSDQSTIADNCTKLKYCANGQVYASAYSCPRNGYCGRHEGKDACFCRQGFQWDRAFKNCIR